MRRKMNDNRYAAPSAAVIDHEPAPIERPRAVVRGVWLLWLSTACVVPAAIYEVAVPPPDVTPTENVLVNLGGLVFNLGLAWIFNTATWRGRNWGRWVVTVMIALGAIATLFMLAIRPRFPDYWLPGYVLAQFVAQNVIGIAAIAFLFRRGANAWFAAMSARRRSA
jgi:hypothetical protein